MRATIGRLALLLSCCVAMTACSAAETPSTSSTSSPTATRLAAKTSSCVTAPPSNPTIRITSPKAGEVVPAGSVTIAFEVVGAELVAFQLAKCPNDYHVHVVLDRDVTTYLGTDVPAPLTADFKHTPFAGNDEPRNVTFADVPAGQHTTFAWLALADHASIRPAVSTSVTFVVR